MISSKRVRLLYVGRRRQVVEELRAVLTPADVSGAHVNTEQADAAIELVAVTSQKAALGRIRAWPPHAILVEIGARQQSRARFCQVLRRRLPLVTILAVGQEGLQESPAVCDGFIRLPLVPDQVNRAIHAALDVYDEHILQVGPIRLDINTRIVGGPAGEHRLTPKQCQLLRLLMERAGQVVNRQEIMVVIWDTVYLGDTRTLDVHIRWLREQIEPNPSRPIYLLTVRGVGYRLVGGRGGE